MGYIKCPRCELNYMSDTERYCTVCKRDMHGEEEQREEVELCSACGERPAVLGEELCSSCMKELTRQEGVVTDVDEDEAAPEEAEVPTMEATSELEEIEIEVDEDIPSTEYSEIHKELGMDDEPEDEDAEDE